MLKLNCVSYNQSQGPVNEIFQILLVGKQMKHNSLQIGQQNFREQKEFQDYLIQFIHFTGAKTEAQRGVKDISGYAAGKQQS